MSFIYEVRLGGHLSRTVRAEFEELGLAAKDRPAETILYGRVVDRRAIRPRTARRDPRPRAGRAPPPAAATAGPDVRSG